MRQTGAALAFVPSSLQGDREVVIAAATQDYYAAFSFVPLAVMLSNPGLATELDALRREQPVPAEHTCANPLYQQMAQNYGFVDCAAFAATMSGDQPLLTGVATGASLTAGGLDLVAQLVCAAFEKVQGAPMPPDTEASVPAGGTSPGGSGGNVPAPGIPVVNSAPGNGGGTTTTYTTYTSTVTTKTTATTVTTRTTATTVTTKTPRRRHARDSVYEYPLDAGSPSNNPTMNPTASATKIVTEASLSPSPSPSLSHMRSPSPSPSPDVAAPDASAVLSASAPTAHPSPSPTPAPIVRRAADERSGVRAYAAVCSGSQLPRTITNRHQLLGHLIAAICENITRADSTAIEKLCTDFEANVVAHGRPGPLNPRNPLCADAEKLVPANADYCGKLEQNLDIALARFVVESNPGGKPPGLTEDEWTNIGIVANNSTVVLAGDKPASGAEGKKSSDGGVIAAAIVVPLLIVVGGMGVWLWSRRGNRCGGAEHHRNDRGERVPVGGGGELPQPVVYKKKMVRASSVTSL